MTEEEIIKALECCIKPTSDCENCPYYKEEECFDMAKRDALNLIIRQQAENQNLKGHLEQLKSRYDNAKAEIERLSNSAKQWEDTAKDLFTSRENAKTEAIKEFKNKLENDVVTLLGKSNCTDFVNCLDYRYKEMVGEQG